VFGYGVGGRAAKTSRSFRRGEKKNNQITTRSKVKKSCEAGSKLDGVARRARRREDTALEDGGSHRRQGKRICAMEAQSLEKKTKLEEIGNITAQLGIRENC